ncbi:hypothetical protein ACJJTC_006312 [Scirpophaga incertulas]
MKCLALLLIVAAVTQGSVLPDSPVYGYLKKSVEIAEQRRQMEQRMLSQRIIGGTPSEVGEFPYQAGLVIDIIGITGRGVCGGSLIAPNKVATAAHCWSDGVHQGWKVTVVLGSVLIFGTDGTRVETSVVASHPSWQPLLVRNDVAVVYLPTNVEYSDNIFPIALPSGPTLEENFERQSAVASGFGVIGDEVGIGAGQFLSHVTLNVIGNNVCRFAFPFILQDSNMCTSGTGGVGVCGGDSGGPLVVIRNGVPTLIGVTSFGSALGCETVLPAVFARVTSFIDFFNEHI